MNAKDDAYRIIDESVSAELAASSLFNEYPEVMEVANEGSAQKVWEFIKSNSLYEPAVPFYGRVFERLNKLAFGERAIGDLEISLEVDLWIADTFENLERVLSQRGSRLTEDMVYNSAINYHFINFKYHALGRSESSQKKKRENYEKGFENEIKAIGQLLKVTPTIGRDLDLARSYHEAARSASRMGASNTLEIGYHMQQFFTLSELAKFTELPDDIRKDLQFAYSHLCKLFSTQYGVALIEPKEWNILFKRSVPE